MREAEVCDGERWRVIPPTFPSVCEACDGRVNGLGSHFKSFPSGGIRGWGQGMGTSEVSEPGWKAWVRLDDSPVIKMKYFYMKYL